MTDMPPPGATTPKLAIIDARTPMDVVRLIDTDKETRDVVDYYHAPDPHGPAATVIGGIVSLAVAHYGLKLSPDATMAVSGAIALLFGYGWQILYRLCFQPAIPTPALFVRQGMPPA